MADIVIPPQLGVASVEWTPRHTSRSGGVSLTGAEQVVQSPAWRWSATLGFQVSPMDGNQSALIYRSLIRRGRAATVLVPEVDTRGPAQYAGLVIPDRGVRHADGASFSDGSGYAQSFTGAKLAGNAALNATQILIGLGVGFVLLPGMRFSTPDYRMHEIDEILGVDGTTWTVRIAPWLRASYPADTPLNFDRPTCRMRLASDDTGALTITNRALSTPSIAFVEAF